MTQTTGQMRRDIALGWRLISLLIGLLLSGQISAADILLTAAEETLNIRAFANEVALRRPDDQVRFAATWRLPPPGQIARDTRLVLLDEGSLDWRLLDSEGPATLVLRISRVEAHQRLGEKRLPGLTLLWSDPPAARQLKLIRMLMPQAREVGVLFDRHSQFLLKEIRHAAAPLGLKIVSQFWTPTENSQPLQSLLVRSDVLLGLDDADLYNAKTAKNLLLSSNARKQSLVGPTAAFVKVGSLASTYTDQIDWLNTLDSLLDQPTGQWPSALYPEHFKVTSNPRVARSLGITPIDDAALADSLNDAEHRP